MRRRNEWHAPSEEQMRWAAQIGLKIPEGISRRELRVLLGAAQDKHTIARFKELNLAEGMRFRRKLDGVTYTIRGYSLPRKGVKAYNERSNRVVEISFASFLQFYELIE